MADGSDDPRLIDPLARLVERGVVVAAASRYSPGGQQVGGPMLKGMLSRAAGPHPRARSPGSAPTTPPTASRPTTPTSSARSGSHSRSGFEIGLELTAKARRLRLPVAELPTIWLDRTMGESRFDLKGWIPKYLRWYRFAYGPRADGGAGPRPRRAEDCRAQRAEQDTETMSEGPGQRVLVTGSAGFIGGYVVEELLARGYSVTGIDNYSKYGPVTKSYDDHPAYPSSRATSATSS